MNSILFVDDDKRILNAIKRNMRRENYHIFYASSASEALSLLKVEAVSILVADISMPKVGGVELLKVVEEQYPQIIRLALTGINDLNEVIHIFEEVDLFKYITKPWDGEELKKIIREAMEEWNSRL